MRKHGHPPLPLRRRPCLRTSTPLLRYSFSVRGSWFPLDLLSTFPFDRVVFATTGNSVASGFVRLVKVLRVSRLLKVINKSQTLRFSASVRIARVLSIWLWFAHLLACLFHLLGSTQSHYTSPRLSAPYLGSPYVLSQGSSSWLDVFEVMISMCMPCIL